MNKDMELYYDYTVSPLGKLFYKTLWNQLSGFEDKKVLDFGSGFAFTTNYMARNNEVTAIEINQSMIDQCKKSEKFLQIHGGIEEVMKIPDAAYDLVICHLVLEFVENPKTIIDELMRVLKKDGVLSLVRHNKNGRIIQAIVQDYDILDAANLLDGGYSYSSAFGDIKYYSNEDLLNLTGSSLTIQKVLGIRVLASLQDEAIQSSEDWVNKMLEIESRLVEEPEFINIAYFNHLLLRKNK